MTKRPRFANQTNTLENSQKSSNILEVDSKSGKRVDVREYRRVDSYTMNLVNSASCHQLRRRMEIEI
ncbi:unnamed protein product [Brassica rapa]|uniref:Uncharacterized protein n=1 Tax=Brassica campestris TaxID=3711 RepID=A0A8D9D023_BRACM|nr:unnamed protein product [Brassica rapa]